MPPWACLLALCSQVDAPRRALPQPPEARLWPSKGVPWGLGPALHSGGNRACSRWGTRDSRPWLPRLPERPRRGRLGKTPQDWTQAFLAAPTVLGVLTPSGIERSHLLRVGRRPQPIGRQGRSTQRGMVGGTRCLRLHPWGWMVAWEGATAQVAEPTVEGRLRQGAERRMVLSDTGCPAAAGDPRPLTLGQRGAGPDRLRGDTGLALLTRVTHVKQVLHRVWAAFPARLACPRAAFNGLGPWPGFQPTRSGFVPLSMAKLSL
jgi:hypothetical protein